MSIESNGKVYEQALKILGINVEYVNETISPQIATYYYNFVDIKHYDKRRLEKAVEKMTIYYHKNFEIVKGNEKAHFGISRPIPQKQTLWLTSLTQPMNHNAITIGKDISGHNVELDFNKISHLLIAGTTGSGKSVLLNTIIAGLYMNMGNDNFEIAIIDPKNTEFKEYAIMPNSKYIDETTEAIATLNDLVGVMEQRYKEMSKGITNHKHLFVVVDELADLMLSSRYDVEETIVRLAQKSRAAKIHLILATQRPTVNVITGLIKANMPNRICLKMVSQIDSRVMLDHNGAEKLLGFGDALIRLDSSTNENRFQCAMISKDNIKNAIRRAIS